jgi:hypothetical protein
MQSLIGILLARAADMLERVDLDPAALRADLGGSRTGAARLYAVAEIISRAADLCCDSAGLLPDNERRWRVCRNRTQQLVEAMGVEAAIIEATAGGGGKEPGAGDDPSGRTSPR